MTQDQLYELRRLLIDSIYGSYEDWKVAQERRKLRWRDRFALWLAKHVRRWERIL